MEADVALRAGAGEAWSMPPTGQPHTDGTPGRGRKAKAKGRGLPQPVTSQSPQQRSRRKQQQQQQQQQQLRLSRSLDDELDAAAADSAKLGKGQGRQGSMSSSRERLLDSDIADALVVTGASTPRRGSVPSQQSPGPSSKPPQNLTPKEQKKSSSRNRRRRAAAAARKQEVGELEGGEGMAQGLVSPDGSGPSLYLDTQSGRGLRLPEPGRGKQEHRQPSMDSLSGRGPRKHSQQSDDGFFSYEPEYGLDPEDQRLKTPDSPQISMAEARLLKEQSGQVQGPPGLPRAGFGYQGNGSEGNGRGRRREKGGGMGRMVPKPSGTKDVLSSDTGLGPDDWNVTERIILSDEHDFHNLVLTEPQGKMTKDVTQKATLVQSLADPHHGKSQGRVGAPSARDPSSLPPRGPTSLSLSSTSEGAGVVHTDKPGSVVILEVKDRPGLYYKSSLRTVSDAPVVMPEDALTSFNPAILASSASPRYHPQQMMSTYQSMALPPQSMGSPQPILPPQSMPMPQTMLPSYSMVHPPHHTVPPHSMIPPHSLVNPHFDQLYTHPGYVPVSNLPHTTCNLPQHSLTPTRLTYSQHLNQSPVMSPQQQMFTPAKSTPLDLSYSPRTTPTAHSAPFASHPMSQLEQVQPAPAHCPPTQSRSTVTHSPSPGLQSKLPGLRRPNLSALQRTVSEESPLDLSVKKSGPPSNMTSSSGASTGLKAASSAKKLSPETPPPLDLRTNVPATVNKTPSTDPSWSPNTAVAATVTEQPLGLTRDLIYARGPPRGDTIVNEPYTSATVSQSELTSRPIDHQPVSLEGAGSKLMSDINTTPEPVKLEVKPIFSQLSSQASADCILPSGQTGITPPIKTIASTSARLPPTAVQPQAESETAGFLNKSEFLQQRAGIKHDDIVVGPRRPISTLLTAHAAKLKEPSNASYNTFPPSHSKPGVSQAENDPKQKDFLSPGDQAQTSNAATETEPKLTKTSQLPSASAQPQDKQTTPPSSTADRDISGGSQTIPRRIPRKIQPDSPQNPRRKAGGSRLPKPMNVHSPDRNLPSDVKLSMASSQPEDTDDTVESFRQPLLAETNLAKAKSSDKSSKEPTPSIESNSDAEVIRTHAIPDGHSETRSSLKSKSHSPPEVANGESYSVVDTSSHAGKSRQMKAAGKSGLPEAVTNTPPSKRKEAAAKLHMLSNIPVPMSHDPRPKPGPQKKQQSMEEDEEEEANDKTPLLSGPLPADAGVKNGQDKRETAKSQNDTTNSSTSSQASTSKSSFTKNGSSSSNSSPETNFSQTNGTGFERRQDSAGEETGLRTIPEQDSLDHGDTLSQNSPTLEPGNTKHISSSADKNGTAKDQSEPPSPCHASSDVNSKLRLHRSAEHLGGQTKLSVFQSDAELITSTSAARTEVAASVPSSPGNHGDIIKVGSYPNTSSACALLDSSSEIEKSPPIVKKKTNLPRIGILRRGSDRTTEICRRASERGGVMAGIPLSSRRHDPSVEDLKRATSISELCQSVASLLNIDNEKAAAMITGDLSTRQDLVDGLDADAIIDYLCHHGVLDTAALPDIDSKTSQSGRNRALLQQVEGRGTTAVALFVNALRQSGQLHLASSLDTEKRIQPSTSGGYFGKGRHKGEVTVRIEVEFLKILAPRELRTDKMVDSSLLNDQLDGTVIEDDDDEVKSRCWCFCLSSRRSKTKSRKKAQSMSPPPDNSMERGAGENGGQGKSKKQQKKSKEKTKGKKSSSSASSKQDVHYQSAKYSLVEPARDQLDGNSRTFDQLGDTGQLPYDQEQQNRLTDTSSPPNSTVNGKHSSNQSASKKNKKDKSRHDPIIMEFDPKLELVKLRAGQDELSSPTRQHHTSSPQHLVGGPEPSVGMLVEQWKSSGPHFQRKASQLCASLVQSARDDLVRYFEQDRGTLVLDVVQDGASVLVVNICMQGSQVKCLLKDVAEAEDEDKAGNTEVNNGVSPGRKKEKSALDEEEEEELGLLDKLQSILFSTVDIRDFDIRGIKLHLALDSQEVDAALSELS